MKTVFNKKETTDILTTNYPYKMEDHDTISFEVMGQTPDRPIEDRSVYLSVKTDVDASKIHNNPVNFSMWLDGEEAIKLGQMLISHGTFALEANIVQHQQRFMQGRLKEYVADGRVKTIFFKNVNTSPNNYGRGFIEFDISVEWNEGKSPKYVEDFSYNEVIYFSPFGSEYDKQIAKYTQGKSEVVFIGYNHEEAVEKFKLRMEGETN